MSRALDYSDNASAIMKELDYLLQHCEVIANADRCDECPLKQCLQIESMADFFAEDTMWTVSDFLDRADEIDCEPTDEDIISDLADRQREDEFVYGE